MFANRLKMKGRCCNCNGKNTIEGQVCFWDVVVWTLIKGFKDGWMNDIA